MTYDIAFEHLITAILHIDTTMMSMMSSMDQDPAAQVRQLVALLAGISDVKPELRLKDLGLDSTRAKALLKTLQQSIRGARGLTLQDLVACETVGDLEAACSGVEQAR